MIEVHAADLYVTASAEESLTDICAALPAGLYPPFPPVALPGGVGGLVSRGGFAQTFFFGAEVLGLTVRAPSGRTVVAGGRTVKNVQGYDLTRPFVGSFGALGAAQTVTLRLRPGVACAHHARPGRLEDAADTLARYLWQDGDTLHALHFGHEREVAAVMGAFGGEPFTGALDYAARFPGGLGIGLDGEGALRDRRFTWADGGAAPEVPALFGRLAASL